MTDLIRDKRQASIKPQGIVQATGLQGVASSWGNVGDVGKQLIRKGEEVERAAVKRYASESMLDAIQAVGQASRDYYEDPEGFVATTTGYMDAALEAAPEGAKENVRNFYTNLISQKSEGIRNRLFNQEVEAAQAANMAAFEELSRDQQNTAFEMGVQYLGSEGGYSPFMESLDVVLADTGKTPEQINRMKRDAKISVTAAALQAEARSYGRGGDLDGFRQFASDFLSTDDDAVVFGEDMSPDERMGVVRDVERVFKNEIAILQGGLKDEAKEVFSDMRLAASNGKRFDKSRAVELGEKLSRAGLEDEAEALYEQVEVQDFTQQVASSSFLEQDAILTDLDSQEVLSREDNLRLAAVRDLVAQRDRALERDLIGYYEGQGVVSTTGAVRLGEQSPDEIASIVQQREANAEIIKEKDGAYLRERGFSVPLWREGELSPLKSFADPGVDIPDKVQLLSSLNQALTPRQQRSLVAQFAKGDNEQKVASYVMANGSKPAQMENVMSVMRGLQLEPTKGEREVVTQVAADYKDAIPDVGLLPQIQNMTQLVYRELAQGEDGFNQDIYDQAVRRVVGPKITRGNMNLRYANSTFIAPTKPDGSFMKDYEVNDLIDSLDDEALINLNGSLPRASNNAVISAEQVRRDAKFFSANGAELIVADPSGAAYLNDNGGYYKIDLTRLSQLLPKDTLRKFLIERRGQEIKSQVPSVRFGGLTPSESRDQAEREVGDE